MSMTIFNLISVVDQNDGYLHSHGTMDLVINL